MGITVKHATQTAKPNDPSKEISSNAWNENHVVEGFPEIQEGDAGKALVVKQDETGFELGGPLAGGMLWVMLGSFDFGDTASATADFPVDNNVYSTYRIVIRGLELEIPVGDTGDFLAADIDVLDSGHSSLLNEIELFSDAYAADWDGSNFVGDRADPIDSVVHINEYGIIIPGQFTAILDISDNTVTGLQYFDKYGFSKPFDSPPSTPAFVRLRAFHFDQSEDDENGAYVPINIIGGTAEMYGLRR